jgi:O-methyltransferase
VVIESAVSPENRKLLVELAATAPPGCFVEVGVYKGGSAYDLYQVAQKQGRKLHLFDSFRGMPVFTNGLDAFKIGTFMVDRDTPSKLKLLMPEAELHQGIYPHTHPNDLTEIAFIHCDCDQYLSYKAVIEHMWPLVVPGGMMLFDDYPYLGGAKKAVEEAFSQDELIKNGEHFYVKKGAIAPAVKMIKPRTKDPFIEERDTPVVTDVDPHLE